MPHKIIYSNEKKQLIFYSWKTKKAVDILNIFEIEASFFSKMCITFKYESGRVTMLNRIKDLHKLINQIKKVNPNIKLKNLRRSQNLALEST